MTKIKICGLKTVEDIAKVNSLLPDYVGFVFAEGSKRQVSIKEAKAMKQALDPRICAVGVFVNESIRQITELVSCSVIDAVQLHGDEDAAYLQALKAAVSCPIIKAIPVGAIPPQLPLGADYLLFDTASKEHGGTGKTFDWSLLPPLQLPYFLAGGLNCSNVEEALVKLQPYCVDVSSGVETDGRKDQKKMRQFIRLVRKEVQP